MDYQAVPFELRELKARGEEGWQFTGYASTFGTVDEGGDMVMHGAFRKSIAARLPKLLWQHNMSEPVGRVVTLREDSHGLVGEFKLSRTARGQDAYQLLKDGAIDSMSIGYIPEDQDFTYDGVRQLKQVDLLEISLVTIPMNEAAVITSVKARERRLAVAAAQLAYSRVRPLEASMSVAQMRRILERRLRRH